MTRLILAACVLACGIASAQLTESEKQLLRGAISAQSADAAGKGNDVATLERIVELGDPALVSSFGTGMQRANAHAMTPEVEAVVVRHFDHPKVGAALRALQGRYASRALFDLHLARVKAAHRSDEPSFEQILRTEQGGIDEDLLAVAARFPSRGGQVSGVASFLGRRRHPGAVPLLLAAIEPAYEPPYNTSLYNPAFELLLGYRSEEVWRKAAAELERVNAKGKVREDQYRHARAKVDPMLADPAAVLARMRGSDVWDEYFKRKLALNPLAKEANDLYRSSPREYVAAQARYLEALEPLAREYSDERIDAEIARSWGALGVYARFVLGDARAALPKLERAARGRDLVGQLVLADTWQLALGDKAAALKAYERALESARQQPPGKYLTPYAGAGSPMNDFWRAWLAAEIEYLRSGKPFAGRIPEPVIAGFWEAVAAWAPLAAHSFPDWPAPMPNPFMTGARAFPSSPPPAPAWETFEKATARLDRAGIAARLPSAPASRYALLATLRYISTLPEPEAIRRELARSDPSGYWTTLFLGTVAFHESTPERRAAALANGLAEALPGMAAKPNVLATAARQHMQSRALRTVEKKP